jgi:hypothetical protein
MHFFVVKSLIIKVFLSEFSPGIFEGHKMKGICLMVHYSREIYSENLKILGIGKLVSRIFMWISNILPKKFQNKFPPSQFMP